jgi:hypothetical protein
MTEEPDPNAPAEAMPRWLWVASAIVVGVPVALVAILSWSLHWSWLPSLWFGYAWPSDKGNGPEALQQTILYAAIALLLIPAVRHFLAREFGKVHAKIDAVHATVKEHHEQATEERAAQRALSHHIILNTPGINNVVPGLDPKFQPPKQEETTSD